jgi:acyl-CoA dehydrogenase
MSSAIKKFIFNFFRQHLPKLSVTEQIALDAGDIWWESDLLNGDPHWQKLHDYPKPSLSSEEQSFLNNQVTTLCSMIDDWQCVAKGDIDKSIWDYLKKEKFWGIAIAKTYGGLGFSAVAHSAIISKIASRSLSVAVATMVPNSLGPAELLQHYGTEQQKNHYLPKLAVGEEIPCFALTGLEIGSDASSMPDIGIVCHGEYQDKKILGIKLTWEKRYITLAPIATVLGLAFKLYDPDQLLGNKRDLGITLCLIPTDHPGVEIGKRHLPAGLAFPNGPTRGKEVFIPLDWIIGDIAMAGQGWRMLMECLSIGRGISLPSLSAGSSQVCYRTTSAYARVRKQFKQPIGQFEGVIAALARIGAFTYLIEATRQLTASAVDLQIKPTVASAIAKYHLTELSRKVVIDAMDVHAGRGVQNGPRNYLATPYLAAPISITVEGANIMTRNLIIYGQGVIRCHRYLKQEMHALAEKDDNKGANEFFTLLLKNIKFGFRNSFMSLWYGLTGGNVIKPFGNYAPLKKYYRQLTRMSTAIAYVSDLTLLSLGGKLKRKEFLSARLGDVLSHLYLASAVIKYHADNQYQEEEWPYVEWCLQYCLQQIQIAFDEFFANFPICWLSHVLQWKIFPWGRAYQAPSDSLSKQIAKQMQKPSQLRDRLTQFSYHSTNPLDPIGCVDHALQLQIQVESIEKKIKLKEALSQDEKKLWEQAEAARIAAIQVDEF